MKMTNEEMGVNIEVLAALKETGKLGYAVARNLRKMKEEAKEYLDLRRELLSKYGKPTDDGKIFVFGENFKHYQEELGDIPKIEHEVEVFTVSEDEFIAGGINSQQMAVLMDWMVKEPDATEKAKKNDKK